MRSCAKVWKKQTKRMNQMIEVLGEIIGITIAGGILYAAKEIKRTADGIRVLDARISRIERWLHGQGFSERAEQPTNDTVTVEKRGSSRESRS